ncbi:uncharacterized protein LOC119837757 [Zerene cesonia]|uniref:uncharacterized protein LOC119837757 n=1 Tax=Zerene cesonia TaxID=33412 RepID=UPI0018E550FA|nr:uncharacterized protein LOC119837757 [Zerene cesonia]
MLSDEVFYYSDAIFQLEINLQNKHRELIAMLDAIEQRDCLVCYQLKCRCNKIVENGNTGGTDKKGDGPAPPTSAKENTNGEIEAWIKSSKITSDTKEMSENEKKVLQIKQSLLKDSAAVEAFFRSFKLPPKTSVTFMSNKLAEAFLRAKQTKAEYSYF